MFFRDDSLFIHPRPDLIPPTSESESPSCTQSPFDMLQLCSSLLLSGILALVPVSDELNAISKLKWVKWMSGQRIYLGRDKEQL
ncbi:hypothetical protein QQF64_027576 [Cirrhinus molitorella]|uniref:Uncharacterized protein n=1 Tax=Cirrhinus molitorella TaxID=172907 RepID=A0ABR3ND22_9TELE